LHVVGGRPVFVDVDALELAVLAQTQVVRAGKLSDDPEHDQCKTAHQQHAAGAADELRLELIQASAVEESLDHVGRVSPGGCRDAVLPRGEESEAQRSPDAAEHVDGYRTDRIVPTAGLHEVDCRSEEHTSELQSPYDLVC